MVVGIELHRVISYDKLFCRCKYDPKSKGQVLFRIEHPRNGKIHEFLKSQIYCDYEEDQIPGVISRPILDKAISLISGFQDVKILNLVMFSRKHIYDGSLVSGFQKSACIGIGGKIRLNSGKIVHLDKIFLEEDSCSKLNNRYFVGRQGIPLLEITTSPAELTGEQVVEMLVKIDDILGRYKNIPITNFSRRQDINVSYFPHPRVEIKGVDKLSLIPKILIKETLRQQQLINQGSFLRSSTRVANPDGSTTYMRDLGTKVRMWPETQIPILNTRNTKRKGYKDLLPPLVFKVLKNKNSCKQLVKLVSFWTENDISLFLFLNRDNPRTAYKWFKMYFQDKISEFSLRKKNYLHCKSISQLEYLKKSYLPSQIKKFYIENKIYFPRSYGLY